MKVGIITLPLFYNYGGILQNFALQKALIKLGHTPITFDRAVKKIPFWKYWASWLKSFCFTYLLRHPRPFVKRSSFNRDPIFDTFIQKNICCSHKINSYRAELIKKFQVDAIIVGSDQVWRPKYNRNLKDMFLDFCKKEKDLKRISYAASFGVENWEYSLEQTTECSVLAKIFDAISVREESGVTLCKEHLGVDASWVLDPTLLLTKDDYCDVCKEVPITQEKFLAAYVLDMNDSIRSQCESIAKERGLALKFFEANTNAVLTVPEWLAMFRDASYVVTNSFHGTVFSIIFEKEFRCLYNQSRGSARFESLLNLYNLGKLEKMRETSLEWLKKAMEA